MNHFTLLDAALLLGIGLYVLAGFRRGLLTAGGALVGFVVGAVLAMSAAPWVASKISSQGLRFVAVATVVVLLLSLFAGLGRRAGQGVRSAISWRPARAVDGLGGGALHLGIAVLLIALMSFGANSLGISAVSRAVATSPVLQAIERHTPDSVQSAFAQLRSPALAETLPQISGAILPGGVKAGADESAQTDAVKAASASVVRVSGVASQCAQSQYGSGFVVAQDRVVTNAHVVAGVSDVVVEVPGSEAVSGHVVYYSAAKDLAVIATNGLQAAPLPTSTGATRGESVAFAGYPLGGPLTVRAGAVQGLTKIDVDRGGSTTAHGLQVYSLAGNVEQGNSGGPLLNLDGEIVGAIFAKSTTQAKVGYALTMDELGPVIDAAPTLTEPVANGTCTQG
ncbi:MarP family serine protease [Falsarthrobacter nasiphocae]|uniref:S1-C subfamily serine protease n=1 Tax=Falsarthrobacter nasiphocae TaxID=189863 RepID=A0AAE4C7A2_9MICC|nr:MarP family serine protease [Falsarthrobacter nasiphocae]MDR6892344.1 S1-C subfamily serine protease [Falsarthrobacter nasiphocae]